jgi:hypothetical protein
MHYGIGYRDFKKLQKVSAFQSFYSVIKEIGRDMFPPMKTKRLLNLQVKGV